MRYEAAARTDVGKVRSENQDSHAMSWGKRPGPKGDVAGVFVVADGVGGRLHGDVASKAFCHELLKGALEVEHWVDYLWEHDRDQRKRMLTLLDQVFSAAAGEVYRRSQENRHLSGMATTGVSLVTVERGAFLAHVGDSRAYLIRGPKVFRLTEDHTVANQLVREGLLAAKDAVGHPYAGSLARAIGPSATVDVDTLFIKVESGDRFVLCSDGLTRYIAGGAMRELSEKHADRQELADALVAAANAAGGEDNVTALVIDAVADRPMTRRKGKRVGLATQLGFMHEMFLFVGLNQQEIMRVMRVGHTVSYKAGAAIIDDGTVGDEMYIVLDGQAVVYKGAEELTTIGPGGHFGELALIDDHARSADVVAKTDMQVMVMKRDDLFGLIREDPGLGSKLLFAFLKNMSARVRGLSENVKSLSNRLYGPPMSG